MLLRKPKQNKTVEEHSQPKPTAYVFKEDALVEKLLGDYTHPESGRISIAKSSLGHEVDFGGWKSLLI